MNFIFDSNNNEAPPTAKHKSFLHSFTLFALLTCPINLITLQTAKNMSMLALNHLFFDDDTSSIGSDDPNYLSDREFEEFNSNDEADTSCADRNAKSLPDTTMYFTNETKQKFHRMICSPSHKNKSRPSAAKYELLARYTAEPLLPAHTQTE